MPVRCSHFSRKVIPEKNGDKSPFSRNRGKELRLSHRHAATRCRRRDGWHFMFQGLGQRLRVKPERPGLTLECDATAAIYQVQSVWPACIRVLGGILDRVNKCGKLDPEVNRTGARECHTLFVFFRVVVDYLFAFVYRQLPGVTWMRFLNVDKVELDLIFVLRVEFVERGNLPAKWRSGVTPKDQGDRLLTSECGELNFGLLIPGFECKIWSIVSNSQSSTPSAQPHRLERKYHKDGDRSPGHHLTEDAGFLAHDYVKAQHHQAIDQEQSGHNS